MSREWPSGLSVVQSVNCGAENEKVVSCTSTLEKNLAFKQVSRLRQYNGTRDGNRGSGLHEKHGDYAMSLRKAVT